MERNYIIEGLFVLLGLAGIITIVKYPKEILLKLPLSIFYSLMIRPIKLILVIPVELIGFFLSSLGNKNKPISPSITKFLNLGIDHDDTPYPSGKNLKFDFKNGDKYIFVISSKKDLKELIEDFIEVLSEKYTIKDFKIISKASQTVIASPEGINFYDFHLMVQQFNTELGNKESFGIYKSAKLQYFVFQDPETLNNLIGFTSDKKLFSIYMLDDLVAKQHLRLNQELNVDTEWVEQWSQASKL